MSRSRVLVVGMLVLTLGIGAAPLRAQVPDASSAGAAPEWPAVTEQTRPWARWWWMGSAVDPEDLTASLEEYRDAGLGGLEITPIYGVHGHEDQFIDYLSPEWVRMLTYTLGEAARLGLGIDMATGTGWPFGGPTIGPEDASKYVTYETYTVAGGSRLEEPVSFTQEPIARAVGHRVDIDQLVRPISANPDLQSLALDQVRFPVRLPLRVLMAYSDGGEVIDLTDRVDADGQLDWVAPPGQWTLYAVFQGWHGKQVERAAPGGEGNVIDYFSRTALDHYLARFDSAFADADVSGLRAFFGDSYEVDDASGQANWTPGFFRAFQDHRGYDLRAHLPGLFGKGTPEENVRVRSDYRETISELLLDNFTVGWHDWAHAHGAIIRDQAHGSPGNILDLYAASDIPETEGTDPLRLKFATSAAHVTGKPLASSETATWLGEHFTSTLADVRVAVDRCFLAGVNHIFYHGVAYSPESAPWPGWLFYAAVHFSPTNSFWTDFSALNHYVARVQSFLQMGVPENDILLYYPIFDQYAIPGNALLEHFDAMSPQWDGTSFEANAKLFAARGYTFDYVSDKQLHGVTVADNTLRTGNTAYRVIVLPRTEYIPMGTFTQLVDLAQAGGTIIVDGSLPANADGLGGLARRQAVLDSLKNTLDFTGSAGGDFREARVGNGRFLLGDDVASMLEHAGVHRESMVDDSLRFVRRRNDDGHTYFIRNAGPDPVDGWVPLEVTAAGAALYDPMLDTRGYARVRSDSDGMAQIYLRLAPGESRVVRTFDSRVSGRTYPYRRASGPAVPLDGEWSIRFIRGGPDLPASIQTDTLESWTNLGGPDTKSFSGTARYTLTFQRPSGGGDAWLLDLGDVRQSARVTLNGTDLGTLIGPDYSIVVNNGQLRERNVLEVDVSNLMANRIADMDRRNVDWKIFYNTNFPARLRENSNEQGLFDASAWPPRDSGLLGPVTLTPIEFPFAAGEQN